MALFSKKHTIPARRRQSSQPTDRTPDSSLEQRYSFRRNRTLTGSTSSQVSATQESNAQLKSPRVQAHELARKRRRIGAVLFLVLVGSLALYGLISQFTANIVVRASDPTITLEPVYEEVLQSYFAAHPGERLRFMLNETSLNEYMQVHTPEVASIEQVGSAGLGKSSYKLTMRRPIAGWSIRGSQQYVDASGAAFERNYYNSPGVQIVDKSGVEVESGQAVASNRFLSFVGLAVGQAKAQGYTVTQVIIPSGVTRQIELRLDGVGYSVKLSVDRSAGEQVEDMARSIRWLHTQGKAPKYLDVRIEGKAFYQES